MGELILPWTTYWKTFDQQIFFQVLHISNIFSLAFNLGCAFAPDTGTLLALRFIGGFVTSCHTQYLISTLTAGFWASAPVAVGGGTIGDLFDVSDRASAMALFSVGPLFGKSL